MARIATKGEASFHLVLATSPHTGVIHLEEFQHATVPPPLSRPGGASPLRLALLRVGRVGSASAATLIVTTPADSGAGSLRAALAAVSDGDTIQFDPALYGQTIALTSAEIVIDRNITISGPGATLLTVSRDSNAAMFFGIVHVTPFHTVTIEGLTISGGRNQAPGGGIFNDQSTLTINDCAVVTNFSNFNGGGIASSGASARLTIVDSAVDGNLGPGSGFGGYGGGIYNEGTLEIRHSSVSGNRIGFNDPPFFGKSGGGIYSNGTTLAISDSTVSGNFAIRDGGGIVNFNGTMTITNSTVSSNTVPGYRGGGIENLGPLTITNCTISGNTVSYKAIGEGGGIFNGGPLTITNSTISGNSADGGGGGIHNLTDPGGDGATIEIGNTILKAGALGANIVSGAGLVISHGYNVSSDDGGGFLTASGDQTNTNPMLGPLQDNGGPTFTHSLLTGSPALDAGNPSFTPPPLSDQRGFARVFNGRIDIGALEVQPPFISGTVSYCSNPALSPLPGVTMTLTGTASTVTTTDASGNYTFAALAAGGSYTVTPTKAPRVPGSANINTVDVIATQRYFLNLGTPLSGCRLTAADVNGDASVNTVDVIAIQRFFLGLSTGIAQVGTYVFNPVNKSYSPLVNGQTGQNFDALILGDVATGFVHRPEGSPPSDGISAGEVPATVATLSLPNVALDAFVTNFILPLTTTAIDAKKKLVGFQGDFTFDERVVTFANEPAQKAGLTGGDWNVSGNVLPGAGPIRTLRISAFSLDFAPLSGSGTLFELSVTKVNKAAQGTPLVWAAPPDHFIFIDADLNTQKPGNAAPGSIISRSSLRRR